jgi:hypothetical protein
MRYSTPYLGVGGRRTREDDEGHGSTELATRTMTARYPGKCSATGAAIQSGDTIEYDRRTRQSRLVAKAQHYVSDVIQTSGGTFYRNKAGRCEDAPCCGCCTI